MRKITLLTLILLVGFSYAQTATNHIILIDNSGSMRGRPVNQGNPDIWKDVKETISDYISQLDVGDIVTVHKFSASLSSPKIIRINSEKDRKRLRNYVENLKAFGGTTCLYTSIHEALEEIAKINTEEKKLFYVFTDFVQACNGEMYTINDIKKEINKSADLEYLYYISFAKDSITKDSIFRQIPTDPDDILSRFPEKPFTVDLSNKRKATLEIAVHKSSALEGTFLPVSFVDEENNIQLSSDSLEINSGKISLEFSISESYYAEKDVVKTLKISGNEKLKVLQDKIQVKFILPKSDKVTLIDDSFTINFYIKRKVKLRVKLTSNRNLHNIEIPFKFNSENKNIEVLTKKAIIKNNEVSIEFGISNSYFAEKDAIGELSFSSTEELQINNETLQLKFALPKKRKVTITFE